MQKEEKEIVECMFNSWIDDDMPLYGGLSYQQVFDLLDKLDIDKSPAVKRIEELEKWAKISLTNSQSQEKS
jgi:hypothetical protein